MNLRKTWLLVIALIIAVGIFAACSNETTDNGSANNGNENIETPSGEEMSYEPLVLYTNSGGENRGDWLTERAAEAGFEITVVHGGGGEIAARLIAEQNNPQADVVFGMTHIDYENFKDEDMLVQYTPAWADEVTEGMNDPEGYYHSIVQQAILMIYNQDVYSEGTAPSDWVDLWENEEFHGKYHLHGNGGATARTYLAGILLRYQDPEGELGISDEGWNAVEQFFANGYYRDESDEFFQLLVDGVAPITGIWSSGISQFEGEYGVEVGIVLPEIGIPHLAEQTAIINGTSALDSAQAFVDWFGSAEIQGEWSTNFGTTPANTGALESAPQEVRDLADSITAQELDWAFISENMELWVEKVELQYWNQ